MGGEQACCSDSKRFYADALTKLVTGELPYQDIQADFAVILKILTEPNPEMHWRFNDVLAIWDMMRGCWAEDPDQRASADRSERVLRLLVSRGV